MVGNDPSPPNLGVTHLTAASVLGVPCSPARSCRLTIALRRYFHNVASADTLASPRERPCRKSFADRSTLVHQAGAPQWGRLMASEG